jgi:hypothetical protein
MIMMQTKNNMTKENVGEQNENKEKMMMNKNIIV